MRACPRFCCVVAAGVVAAGCWQQPAPQAPQFRVGRVSPDLSQRVRLLLNDAITVYFSEPVDPMSVTRDTFAVLDGDGHSVRGHLAVDGSWVTFEPEPPLSTSLLDGSFAPDTEYRLVVVGYPRPDGVRSRSGELLAQGLQRPFRTAALGDGTGTAPLRPLHVDSRPFLLRPAEVGYAPLPIDDARLQLHFTLPVLPTCVAPAAFEISLYRRDLRQIEPRRVRLLPQQAGDEFAGSTIEVEFGSQVVVHGEERPTALQPDDLVVVRLATGEHALRDYAGRPAPPQVQWCNVVAGEAVNVAQWPDEAARRYLDVALEVPGFEVTENLSIQPLVRVEAGDGSLGVFHPQVDTTIVAGEAFDRGDGMRVASADEVIAFRAIDIPPGVTVRVDARAGRLQLLALGRVRIAGRLEILGDAPPPQLQAGQLADFTAIRAASVLTIVAGSGIAVLGTVDGKAPSGGPLLALVTAGALEIGGSLPIGTVLAAERGGLVAPNGADRCLVARVQLTPGLPPGAEAVATGFTPFSALPPDRAAGSLRLRPADSEIRVAWQVTQPDPVLHSRPDRDPSRAAPPREATDGQRVDAPPGAFLRLRLQARVVGGAPLPRLLQVDVLDR